MTEVARLVLAVVFGAAGLAKLADRRGSQEALSGFGMPRRLVVPVAILLPLAELAIAGALVPAATALYAAAAALAFLAVFAAAIGVARVRGRMPDCHCFGQLHSAPAGWTTLARNAALAGLAIVVLFQPSTAPSAFELAIFAAVAIIAGQALLSMKLLRRYRRALQRIAELEAGAHAPVRLEVGSPAPAFALPDATGRFHTLEDLLVPGVPVALVFSDPDCPNCAYLTDGLAELQRRLEGELAIALVTRGVAGHGTFEPVLLQDENEVARVYGIAHLPSALLVAPDGLVASELAVGEPAIEELLAPRALRAVS